MPEYCVPIWFHALQGTRNQYIKSYAERICPPPNPANPANPGINTFFQIDYSSGATDQKCYFQYFFVKRDPSLINPENTYDLSRESDLLSDFLFPFAIDGRHDQYSIQDSIKNITGFFTTRIEPRINSTFEAATNKSTTTATSKSKTASTTRVIEDRYAKFVLDYCSFSDSNVAQGMNTAVAQQSLPDHVSFVANNSAYFPYTNTFDTTPFQLMDTGVSLGLSRYSNLYIKPTHLKFLYKDGNYVEICMYFDFLNEAGVSCIGGTFQSVYDLYGYCKHHDFT
jgi:hypothetical protein